jgi:hypothetical protein
MKSKEIISIESKINEDEIFALVQRIVDNNGYNYSPGFFHGYWYCRSGQWFWRPVAALACFIFGHNVFDGSDCYRCG